MARTEWVLLFYRLPREPSTPRIALWRKLRRLGVATVVDGVVGLPLDSRNREQLEWLANEVVDGGGEATIWVASPGTAAHERVLAAGMSERVAAEYRAIIADAARAAGAGESERRRTLARLRRQLRRVGSRDYFPPAERAEARDAVERLAAQVIEATG